MSDLEDDVGFQIKRMTVKSGDSITKSFDAMKIKFGFPDDVNFMLLDGGMDLEILEKDNG